jgi:hypothetical protein
VLREKGRGRGRKNDKENQNQAAPLEAMLNNMHTDR